jgi:aspartyl-tRNA(Asn)/glutamyl-tRNA(Gln) amidotransferase subunit C
VAADASSVDVTRDNASHPSLTKENVSYLAHLARLELTDAEVDTYVGQLSVILDSVATVSRVAAVDIVPTSHAVPLVNVFREDVVGACLTNAEALDQAPSVEDERFRVPQILSEE